MDDRMIRPTLHEHEGGQHLLVWSDQGQWMLVDESCARLLTECAPGCGAAEAVEWAVARGMGERDRVRRDVDRIWAALSSKRLLLRSEQPPDAQTHVLSNITVNLTNRCNLRCTHCYNHARTEHEVPVSTLLRALSATRVKLSRSSNLIVLGGEPMSRFEDLLALIDGARHIFGPPIVLSTNGTLVTAQRARMLARRAVDVQVSVDGACAAEHDAVRGDGTFERALRGIRRLVDAGVPTTMSMVYSSSTIQSFESYLDLARSMGVQHARFIPLRAIGRGSELRSILPDPLLALEHLLDVLERRVDLRGLLGRDYFSTLVQQCARTATRTSCGIGERVLFIDSDGTVYPCPNHVRPAMRVGSIHTDDLGALLDQSPVLQSIRRRYSVERYDACARCPVRRWCAGDCRGEVWALSGTDTAPSPHCASLKQLYVRTFWLAARRDTRLPVRSAELMPC